MSVGEIAEAETLDKSMLMVMSGSSLDSGRIKKILIVNARDGWQEAYPHLILRDLFEVPKMHLRNPPG